MEIDVTRIQTLEVLVDELLKDSPKEDIIKEQMEKVGLEYEMDPVERLNSVLQALHFQQPRAKFSDED